MKQSLLYLLNFFLLALPLSLMLIETVSAQSGETKLPDTAVGQRLALLIKAFNSGDDAVMRDFHLNNDDQSLFAKVPIDRLMVMERQLYDQFGGYELLQVLDATDSKINVLLKAKKGQLLNFNLETDATPQHKITNLLVQQDAAIEPAARAEAIDGILKALNSYYVFPEVAKQMEQAIRTRIEQHQYDKVISASQLVILLTDNLREVSHDKHLRVGYSPQPMPVEDEHKETTAEEREERRSFLAKLNFGFEKIERLKGNIGYLDLRGFISPEFGSETAVAAMNFLANTDALIIDLRNNGGGDPAMVALISSYLFSGDPVHLNSLYWREDDSTHQWWTLPYVPGKRYGDKKEVYILTSKQTFSAAEEFTYNLKNLQRATVVGETTGGGAHPTLQRRINEHFFVLVPMGRAINPITKTNWEGTGVKPDLDVPADQALKTAQLSAMKKLIEKTPDEQRKRTLSFEMEILQKELEEMKKN